MQNYNILTLGASGAGKTVFLASMFKALSIQSDDNFSLKVENDQDRKRLNSIYTEILTGENWPPGTKDASKWIFTCSVQTPNLDRYDACKFIYFDYAGGSLTDVDVDDDPELKARVQKADAILGLLDGQKIHAWLSGSNQRAVDIFLNEDLPSILRQMRDSTIPIHFVISKWDILDNAQFSLNQVRERLFSIPDFEQLVRNRNKVGSPVRLIPVSSVGLNFAEPQPDGSMKKIPGAVPKPFKVEAPLAFVLADKLLQVLKEKEKQDINENNLEDILRQLGIGMRFIDFILEFEDEDYFQEIQVLVKALSFFNSLVVQVRRIFRKKTTLKDVKNEQTALIHAIKRFGEIQTQLNRDFPESELFLP